MSRKAEPGISYYPMRVNHTQNSKLRLLFNEFGSDGYWIWSCLLGQIYEDKGYYYDTGNEDELELFATDVCKKRVALVKEVIEGCVRRGLFDKPVFDMFQLLTSDRIQLNYLEATSERRRKGTVIVLIEELVLVDLEESNKSLQIVGMNDIFPGKYSIPPRKNPQSRVKGKYSKGEESTDGEPPSRPAEDLALFKKFQDWLLKNAANVAKMKEPFTIEQYFAAKEKYKPEQLKEILLAMHNHKPLLSKNISAYLTVLNWLKRREENNTAPPSGNDTMDYLEKRKKDEERLQAKIGK